MKWQNFTDFFKNNNKRNWLLVIGIIGIILIGLSTLLSDNSTQEADQTDQRETTEEYAVRLENELSSLLETIHGVGSCKVMVTIEQGTEYIYATQEKTNVDVTETSEESRFSAENKTAGEETYIMVSTENGEQPLLITQLSPKVKGVIIVCTGGGDPVVCQSVSKAVSTALDISESRICVIQGL